MLRRILTIALAVLVLAVVVPFGAALTLERRLPMTTRSLPSAVSVHHEAESAPLPESAALALTGTVLIGLAAAVRRATVNPR
jgi:hypothetical protein